MLSIRRRYDLCVQQTRVTVTVRREVLKRAERQVKRGKAKSVSVGIDSAMEEKARREDLVALLAEMRAESGPPTRELAFDTREPSTSPLSPVSPVRV